VVRVSLLGLGLDEAFLVHLAESLVSNVRANSVTTETEQSRKVVHLASVAALGENGSLGALLGTQEMLVDSTDGNQGRDRHPIRARKAVGENDTLYSTDAKIALHRTGCLVANSIDRVEHALCPTAYGHGAVDDSGTEDVLSIYGEQSERP